MRLLVTATVLFGLAAPVSAEVVASSESGFAVRNVAQISAHATRVYQVSVDFINQWWNPAHTFSKAAVNLRLDPRPGGCFCERLPNGGAEHLRVVYVVPSKEIRFTGGLGPLQQAGVAGSLIWKLTETIGGTQLEWSYTVGGYYPGGFAVLAPAVDAVLAGQLQRLKRFVESGRPE